MDTYLTGTDQETPASDPHSCQDTDNEQETTVASPQRYEHVRQIPMDTSPFNDRLEMSCNARAVRATADLLRWSHEADFQNWNDEIADGVTHADAFRTGRVQRLDNDLHERGAVQHGIDSTYGQR